MPYLIIFFGFFYLFFQIIFHHLFNQYTHNIIDLNIIHNNLYHLHYDCKLLKITESIIYKKIDKFRMSSTIIAIAVIVVAQVLANRFTNFICYIIDINLYYLQYDCKLLKITLSIIAKNVDEFRTSGTATTVVIAAVA